MPTGVQTVFQTPDVNLAKATTHAPVGGTDRANLFDTNEDDSFEANPADALITDPELDSKDGGTGRISS